MRAKDELARLQAANLPKATPAIFDAKVSADAPDMAQAEKYMAELADYLSAFVPPQPDCICCGSLLGAKDIADAFIRGSSFRWGLAWGEGECSACGYPARAHHRIGDWFSLNNYILQYHPSGLSVTEPEKEEAEV